MNPYWEEIFQTPLETVGEKVRPFGVLPGLFALPVVAPFQVMELPELPAPILFSV